MLKVTQRPAKVTGRATQKQTSRLRLLATRIRTNPRLSLLSTLGVAVIIGMGSLALTRADTPYINAEAESGSRSGSATLVADAAASGGNAVKFGAATIPSGGAIATITFDDGTVGQFTNAAPSLRSHNFRATYFLISNTIGGSGYISSTQARQLASEGFEIGSHSKSHPDMRGYSYAQVDAEYGGAQTAIQALTGVTPKTCGYPYGAYNATIDSVVRKYFRGCRSSAYDQIYINTANLWDLPNYSMGPTSTTSTVKQLLDRSIANKTWVIFSFHQVGTGGDLNVTTAMFNSMMDTIQASGIRVLTMDQALTALGK
ncbi:MAG TPA: polysaccharide deacetylase family protein [Candidatus Saccharimonadales bacterium]|jgi:peptidoglycan/xylan/chitin deacetylase (PgdA/CDA1 family)